MNVKIIPKTSWLDVLNAARFTVHKAESDKEPSDLFKSAILRAEHSPIRTLEYEIVFEDIPYFVAMHLARHNIGVKWFAATQREDRAGNTTSRHDLPQDAPVDIKCWANAQALINISRKRLCGCAYRDTRMVWKAVKTAMESIDKPMADAMVSECIHRGFCPEMHGCGYCYSAFYERELNEYRKPTIVYRNK